MRLKMRCLFCKKDSSTSRSVEHIIPESLGNTEHVLPAGIVCDKCNNYFAREIEKPLLDSQYFRERRFHRGIANKKNRIPPVEGIHLQSKTVISFAKEGGEEMVGIGAYSDVYEFPFVKTILSDTQGTLVIPIGEVPNNRLISRFLGKVGLEVLAYRVLHLSGGIDEIIENHQLDELRLHVRQGNPKKLWPYSHRAIYPSDFLFTEGAAHYEVLHEFDILVTPANEYYIVLAVFGEEYALNLGGPEIDGYKCWLEKNHTGAFYTNHQRARKHSLIKEKTVN